MIAVFFAWWPMAAVAGTVRVIYLPLSGVNGEPDARIDESLSAELAEQPQLFVQVPGAKKTKVETWHAIKGDRSWWVAAQKAVDAGALESAVGKLKKGLQGAWKKPEASDTGIIADAQLLLSVTQFRRGNEDDGTRALNEYVRLRPDAPLTGDYPPLFVRLHAQARKRWQAKATAQLRVDLDADVGGVVVVDGHEVGKAPLVLEHLTPGSHLIAFASGDKQIVRRVEVGGALESIRFAVTGPRRNPLFRNAFVRWSKAELAGFARDEGAAYTVTGTMLSNGAGAGHTLAVVIVSSSGDGAVATVARLGEAQSNWGVEMNRIGAKIVQLAASGFKDEDRAPLIDATLTGVASDGLMHYDFFPKTAAPVKVVAAVVERPQAPVPEAPVAKPVPTPAKPVVVVHAEPASRPLAPVKAEAIHAEPDTPHVLLTSKPLSAPEEPSVHTPVYKQWWLWTLVGAAVAGGVVAVVVVSTAKVGQVQVNATW